MTNVENLQNSSAEQHHATMTQSPQETDASPTEMGARPKVAANKRKPRKPKQVKSTDTKGEGQSKRGKKVKFEKMDESREKAKVNIETIESDGSAPIAKRRASHLSDVPPTSSSPDVHITSVPNNEPNAISTPEEVKSNDIGPVDATKKKPKEKKPSLSRKRALPKDSTTEASPAAETGNGKFKQGSCKRCSLNHIKTCQFYQDASLPEQTVSIVSRLSV